LFGIETINRKLGGVYVGVNKAVGKHHWEVFCDEGRDSAELANWLLQDYAHRLKPLATLILNGPVIPAHTIGKSNKVAEFREWLAGMDLTQMTRSHNRPPSGRAS
jgi:hypothetical protein